MPIVNDVHSRLNATDVRTVLRPGAVAEVQRAVRDAVGCGESIAVCGARHAMGGQQFLGGRVLVDLRRMNRVLGLDEQRGLLRMEAGADWREVVAATEPWRGSGGWSIRQKQTGADELTLGGAVACNAHGRGLAMGPLCDDVEALALVDAMGDVRTCSRGENAELFRHVIGGYGLFGVVVDVTLRLRRRARMVRHVDVLDLDDAAAAFWRRLEQGYEYGDFQYAIDPRDDAFLRRGVMACYRAVAEEPTDEGASVVEGDLSRQAWIDLLHLAHTDKRRAFDAYARHYLGTHGRTYWSDAMQLSTYIPSYAEFLAERGLTPTGGAREESLMITELSVPPAQLLAFMREARGVLRATGVEDVYGTIRAIRRDTLTALPWAKADLACVIFNLRTPHSDEGIGRTREACRGLIDAAAGFGGTFYPTYHRWATAEQWRACHPAIEAFAEAKRRWDPQGTLSSEWWCGLSQTMGWTRPSEPGPILATSSFSKT